MTIIAVISETSNIFQMIFMIITTTKPQPTHQIRKQFVDTHQQIKSSYQPNQIMMSHHDMRQQAEVVRSTPIGPIFSSNNKNSTTSSWKERLEINSH